MKKEHIKPAIRVYNIRQAQFICQSEVSSVSSVSSGGVFSDVPITGGSGGARSRGYDIYDEDE